MADEDLLVDGVLDIPDEDEFEIPDEEDDDLPELPELDPKSLKKEGFSVDDDDLDDDEDEDDDDIEP